MSTHCHIIVNQHSGNGQGKKTALSLEKMLQKKKISYVFYLTEYAGHAVSLVEKVVSHLQKKEDRLWVIGGDGTLHEVISGIKKLDFDVPVGYFPSGTGNDFARSIGISSKLEQNFQTLLLAEEPSVIECFIYENKHSSVKGIGLNSLGIGFDAEVTQIAKKKNQDKGWLSVVKMDRFVYLWSIAQAFKKRKTFQAKITVDGVITDSSDILIVAVMNHPYFGGGIKIDPESAVNSQELAVMIIKNLSVPVLLKLLRKVMTDGSHVDSPYFLRIPGTQINIQTTSPQLSQVDGEVLDKSDVNIDFKITTFKLWK